MEKMARSCVQSILKMVNSLIGMAGMAMILYSVWLITVWEKKMGEFPFSDSNSDPSAPWFIYSFLGLGVSLCMIACAGHIAAHTINGCCLYLYMGFVYLIFLVEIGVLANIFLNSKWEEDFPKDPSGSFNQFKSFVKSNSDICKWIGLSLVSVQGISFLLAMILQTLGPHRYYYDSDEDYDYHHPGYVPFLKNVGHTRHTYVC